VNNRLILADKRNSGKHLVGHWEFPGGKIEPCETPEQFTNILGKSRREFYYRKYYAFE
jgi:8-oxo-dGTP pyrophosphatase MutT (NUDIX family)